MEQIPFVERLFTVDGQNVSCRFFRPETDGLSFRCRFEIYWPEGVRSKSMGGVDEVQALLLAMSIAHTDLLSARENDGREVLYLDQRDLDLPFAEAIRDWVAKG
jgi:hypothetical protein